MNCVARMSRSQIELCLVCVRWAQMDFGFEVYSVLLEWGYGSVAQA